MRVAGAGAERAHDNRCTALLAAEEFGDGVDVIDGKPDDSSPSRHSADLLGACIGQLREPFALGELGARLERCDRPTHGVAAHEKGLVKSACAQKTVSKDVAAFGIGAQLDFVDSQEIYAHAFGHRFDRADPVLRSFRNDPFFAGDQGDDGWSANGDDPIINFARQKAERQADYPGAMPEHALDSIVRFTGIGWAEDRDNAALGLGHEG